LNGTDPSQFMLISALKEAKNVFLDQSTIHAGIHEFQKIMEWLDAEASSTETAGMVRLLIARAPWHGA
jgi:uncharacterized protein (DUF1778 family)